MRASFWMSQERADFIRRFLRKNVFELAGLLGDLCFTFHVQTVGEKALGQAVAANNITCAFTSSMCHLDHVAAFRG